jgi:hypothetical protein
VPVSGISELSEAIVDNGEVYEQCQDYKEHQNGSSYTSVARSDLQTIASAEWIFCD